MQRQHDNHMGKAVPLGYIAQRDQFRGLDDPKDYITIQKGDFLNLIPNVSCRGYYSEIGTNIMTKDRPSIPKCMYDLAARCAVENLADEITRATAIGKKALTSDDKKVSCEFGQFVVSLAYASWNQLQGPFYNNGTRGV